MAATSLEFRLTTAAVFAVTGGVIAAAIYGPLVFAAGHASASVLFVVLPGVAGGIAGLVGAPLIAHTRCTTATAAALGGAAIGIGALLVFAPLFALGIKLTEPGWTGLGGLSAMVVLFGLLAVGWIVALAGAVAGWAVWRRY